MRGSLIAAFHYVRKDNGHLRSFSDLLRDRRHPIGFRIDVLVASSTLSRHGGSATVSPGINTSVSSGNIAFIMPCPYSNANSIIYTSLYKDNFLICESDARLDPYKESAGLGLCQYLVILCSKPKSCLLFVLLDNLLQIVRVKADLTAKWC